MRKTCIRERFAHGAVSLLLAVTVLLALCPLRAEASGGKDSKSRAIAIVFDNSGSMYIRGNQAWCRATYGIEVFAAMMNEGDSLSVYPMWPIEADGMEYTSDEPLTVRSGQSISSIRQMYTPEAGATPIETIRSASEGLKRAQADERWLIVLTDGDDFYEDNRSLGSATTEKLSETLAACSGSMNVMYLGIGKSAIIPEVTTTGRYTYYADKASDSQTILAKLTAMSNNIFGRDVLETSGSDVSFDLSMSKLIVFVQGEGVADITLTGKNDGTLVQAIDSYAPHYGEKGAGGRYAGQFGIDRSLQGVLMTYENVDAGDYAIGYAGTASSVSIYYEPDVDLQLFLLDRKGNAATADTAYPGAYTVNAQLVDKNGNATESSLLGKTDYTISCTVNGEKHTAHGDSAGYMEIDLAEGDSVDFGAEVTYLSGYHIEKEGSDMGWPTFTVLPKRAFDYDLKLTIPQKYIMLSKIKDAPAIEANVYVNGEPVTPELCEKLDVEVACDGIGFRTARKEDGSGFLLKLETDKAVKSGKYPFVCRVSGLDDNDEEVLLSDEGTLTVKPYPQWLIYLILFLILALLAFLIWLYLNTKVLPKRIDVLGTDYSVDGEKVTGRAACRYVGGGGKRGTVTIIAPRCPTNPFAKGSFTMEVEAVSPRRVRSASRGIRVVGVTADRAMSNVKIGPTQLVKDAQGRLTKPGGKANTSISFDIYSGAKCSMSGEVLDNDEGTASLSMATKLKFN